METPCEIISEGFFPKAAGPRMEWEMGKAQMEAAIRWGNISEHRDIKCTLNSVILGSAVSLDDNCLKDIFKHATYNSYQDE